MRDALSLPSGELLQIANPTEFLSSVTFTQLPVTEPAEVSGTTPSALNVSSIKLENGSATTITNFTDGADGQLLTVVGDGNSTLTHGTNIFTSTGANKLLVADGVYQFLKVGGVWRELAQQSSSLIERLSLYQERSIILDSTGNTYAIPGSTILLDLREFSNVRASLNHRNNANYCEWYLQYATSFAGSYTTIATIPQNSGLSAEALFTATAALPAGAQIQNCYLRGAYSPAFNSGTSIVSLTLELY